MIRYRDGKIVSTKGERYTQVTKAESEEMKKSIVNNSWQLLKFTFFKILFDIRWQLTNFKTNIFLSLSLYLHAALPISYFHWKNWVKLHNYIFFTCINNFFHFTEKKLLSHFFFVKFHRNSDKHLASPLHFDV